MPRAAAQVLIPFDRSLAPGGSISDAFATLRPQTAAALRRQWLPLLEQMHG